MLSDCEGRSNIVKTMIPEMPPLIPTNTSLIPIYTVHESEQMILPSDAEIHQNIEDQVQIVKKFQQILFQEEMKLEMMKRMFKDRNEKMNLGQSGKKRRGRPPGSKAKKTIAAKNRKTFFYFDFGNQ